MITYSDLITLLLIFFIIMYAMSKVDIAKFLTLSESLNQALNPSNQIPLNGLGKTALLSVENPSVGRTTSRSAATLGTASLTAAQRKQVQQIIAEDKQFSNLYASLEHYIKAHGLSASVTIQNQQRGIQISLSDVVFFNTGEATLQAQDMVVLAGLVPFLQQLSNQILVEGYTDSVPIHTGQFPSNWELSTGRALTVLEFLQGHGISPRRLSAVGYGQYHPLYSNATHVGRAQNRRVNIVILRNWVASLAEAGAYGGPAVNNSLSAIEQPVGPKAAKFSGAK